MLFALHRRARVCDRPPGRALERYFPALVAQGIGMWLGVQAIINMGVNMGVLPTKGLTLPLLSFGGSGIVGELLRAGDPAARRLGKPPDDAGGKV